MKKFFVLSVGLFLVVSLSGQVMFKGIPTADSPHIKNFGPKNDIRNMYSVRDFSKALLGDTIVVGTSTYDSESNGIGIRHIYYDSGAMAGYELTGVVWIHSDQPATWPERHMYYWSPVAGGAGAVQTNYRDGYGMIDYRTTGDAIVSEHYYDTLSYYYCSAVGYETFGPGYASFSISECPPAPDNDAIWPRVGVDAKDNVLVLSRTYQQNGYTRLFYTKTTWGNWATDDWSPWILLDTCGYGTHNLVASKLSSKFAAAYEYSAIGGETDPGRLARNGHLYVKVSTDGGANWNTTMDMDQFLPTQDSLRCLRSPSPFFDDIDSLHLVFIGVLSIPEPGYWAPNSHVELWHWSYNTGLSKITDYGWTPYNVIPGDQFDRMELTYYLDVPSIGENTDTKDLFVVYHSFPWDEEDPVDSAQTGEIYLARSRDGGITWGQPVDLTNTPNHSEIYPSISPFFQGDTVRISYLDDVYGGSYVNYGFGFGSVDSIVADNPYVYMKVPVPPDGDARVVSVDSPLPNFNGYIVVESGDTITPSATIGYSGSVSADVQVRCKIWVGETSWTGYNFGYNELYSQRQDLSMSSGASTPVTFPSFVVPNITPFNVDSAGYGMYFSHILHVEVFAAYLGDNNVSNDVRMSDSINVMGYQQDFAQGDGGYAGTGWILGNIKADSTTTDTIGPGDNFGISKDWSVTVDDTLSWHTISPYGDNAADTLTVPETLTIYNPDNCWLSYRQWFQTEKGADGGNVKISLDHGATWITLDSFYLNDNDTVLMGYPDSMNANNAAIPNELAFGGDSIGGQISKNWHKITFNLSPYTTGMKDSTLLIKWVFGSDNNGTVDEGWGIDYVQVFGVYSSLVSGIPNPRFTRHNPILTTMKAYPNPMRGTGKVKFEIGRRCNTLINLYDVAGRRVKSIYKGMLNPGMHTVRWNAKNLPAGIYFIRVDTENAHMVKKVVHLR